MVYNREAVKVRKKCVLFEIHFYANKANKVPLSFRFLLLPNSVTSEPPLSNNNNTWYTRKGIHECVNCLEQNTNFLNFHHRNTMSVTVEYTARYLVKIVLIIFMNEI